MSFLIGGQRPEVRSPADHNKWDSAEFSEVGVVTLEDATVSAQRGLEDYNKAVSGRSGPVAEKACACFSLCNSVLAGADYPSAINKAAEETGINLDPAVMEVEGLEDAMEVESLDDAMEVEGLEDAMEVESLDDAMEVEGPDHSAESEVNHTGTKAYRMSSPG